MKQKLLMYLLLASLIFTFISAFEILNVGDYYEDQDFINAPVSELHSIKIVEYCAIIATIIFLITTVILIILIDDKK